MTQRATHDVLSFDYPAKPNVGSTAFFQAEGAGTWDIQSAIARNGRKALRLQPSANQAWVEKKGISFVADGLTGRFYIYFTTFPDADVYLLSYRDNASPTTKHEGFAFHAATNRIRPVVGTNLGADGAAIATGVWYRVDYHITYNTTTDAYAMQWKLDGATQTTQSLTTALGCDSTNLVRFGNWDANCSGDFCFDDYVFLQNLGNYPTYPIGAGECFYRTGTADGTHNNPSNFSDEVPNSPPAAVWSRLDEGPSSSTSDYVYQDTASGTSYLEVTTEDIVSDAVRMHGGLLRWEHTRSTASANGGLVRIWSPDTSSYWADVGDGSVSTGKQIVQGYALYLADETAFDATKLNRTVVRLGFQGAVTSELRIHDFHEEWALPESAVEMYGWDVILV